MSTSFKTIELRVGPQGIKAKWVRIELRKVETLPGGGLQHTFFDFVGQSPINLWQSGEDYGVLMTQDFPFYIRIPESIPPSITLDRTAGIKYELIATVCVKEKKGFLRRDKSKIINTSSPIVIDKHELHTTWPVYQTSESRDSSVDGMTLTVSRTHTCYGPGDRISVSATVKSDSLHTVILRGFEFTLKETVVFRAGPNTTGKKGAPQVKVAGVAEQKVPVNATIYGGTNHKAELTLTVPSHHTSATINSARHIDITYVLSVKALMANGNPLVMDLPVVISNWPRSVSVEAIKRIGLAFNVSSHTAPSAATAVAQIGRPIASPNPQPPPGSKAALIAAAAQATTPYMHPTPAPPPTTITDNSSEPATESSRVVFNTAPVNGYVSNKLADELGYTRKRGASIEKYTPISPQAQTVGASSSARPFAAELASPRPRSAAGRQGAGQRTLSVVNYADDMPEEVAARNAANAQAAAAARHQRNTSLSARQAPKTDWMSAEEEKKRLYESAKASVDRVQGSASTLQSPPQSPPILSPTPIRDAGPLLTNGDFPSTSRPSKSAWPTAEEEKERLFREARARAAQTQGGSASPPLEQEDRPSGAALYAQAMASVSRNASTSNPLPTTSKPKKGYLTAEEEKAALAARFEDAKARVERNQASAFGSSSSDAAPPVVTSPTSYNTRYPPSQISTNGSATPPANPNPQPTFDYSSPEFSQLSEKERMRRAFEMRDAALAAAAAPAIPMYTEPPPSPPAPRPASSQASSSALSEKERLRRHFEEQDAMRQGTSSPPRPPPRSASTRGLPTPRAQPVPPGGAAGGSPRMLSAAEEKARLAARYAAEDAAGPPPAFPSPTPSFRSTNGVNGYNGANGMNGHVQRQSSLSSVNYSAIPPPPPLMPRPPKEYIQETQEEDQSLAAKLEAIDKNDSGVDLSEEADPPLNLRPFTPFAANFDAQQPISQVVPPPPLPPKVPLEYSDA
ncbi:hypothetical protein EIP86_010820 [Pleurotus ostreatoroseus]|nr:hypothetical protein EIP86_010820 [Pleurotus ostreatoroseus]